MIAYSYYLLTCILTHWPFDIMLKEQHRKSPQACQFAVQNYLKQNLKELILIGSS